MLPAQGGAEYVGRKLSVQDGGLRSRQVRRAVQTLRPCSSLISIWYVATEPPRCSGVATPVTVPLVTARWWVAEISIPTAYPPKSRCACMLDPYEPRVSASTQ